MHVHVCMCMCSWTHIIVNSEKCLELQVKREVGMSGKTLEELIEGLLSLVKKLLTLVIKEPRYLLPRERLEKRKGCTHEDV